MMNNQRRLEEIRECEESACKMTTETNENKLKKLGSIRWNGHFLYDGIIYEVLRGEGPYDKRAIICLNIKTKEEKKFSDNIKVEEITLPKQPVEDNRFISGADFFGMSRKVFLLDKMRDAHSFELSKEEVSSYFEQISLYIEANDYSAFRHMQEKHSIEPLSERQQICSQNAINCLFKKEFVQALHETLDVLSDYNKDTQLNYNEYVVIQNILTVYSHLKEK